MTEAQVAAGRLAIARDMLELVRDNLPADLTRDKAALLALAATKRLARALSAHYKHTQEMAADAHTTP